MKQIQITLIGLLCLLSVLITAPASAQQLSDEPIPESDSSSLSSLKIPTEIVNVWRWPQTDVTEPGFGLGQVSRATIPNLIPPLPFAGPQVGPIVKRQLEEIDTRTRAFVPTLTDGTEAFEFPEDLTEDEHWIRVDLTAQTVTAYVGLEPVRAFLVSTGVPGFNTVTGEFRVRMKVSEQVMSGGGEPGDEGYFYLPNVKWVMYFYDEFALHGSYWHDNFGTPMSHGCVNMTNADAKWLFDFAGPVWDGERIWYKSSAENPGSRVIVHY